MADNAAVVAGTAPVLAQNNNLQDALAEFLGEVTAKMKDSGTLVQAAAAQHLADQQTITEDNQQIGQDSQNLTAANAQIQDDANNKTSEDAMLTTAEQNLATTQQNLAAAQKNAADPALISSLDAATNALRMGQPLPPFPGGPVPDPPAPGGASTDAGAATGGSRA